MKNSLNRRQAKIAAEFLHSGKMPPGKDIYRIDWKIVARYLIDNGLASEINRQFIKLPPDSITPYLEANDELYRSTPYKYIYKQLAPSINWALIIAWVSLIISIFNSTVNFLVIL